MSEPPPTVALVPYPLSNGYRARLEEAIGAEPRYLILGELRRRPPAEVMRTLWSLRGCVCLLPLETGDAGAVRPILEAVAMTMWPSRLEVISPTFEREVVSRRHVAPAVASLVQASASGVTVTRSARRELEQLVPLPRIDPRAGPLDRILFLNANLWVGLKAGGSVGHVAGVVNAFRAAGLEVDYASFAEPIGIAPDVGLCPLQLPATFGLPFEGTYYRAGRATTRQVAEIAVRREPGLIYQRMSIASYAGVVVSRARRIPLVLEYNGSEVWIAKNWGRGLRYEHEAQLAEDVSLRHAHLVVTVSEALRDDLLERGVEAARIVAHPNGVDPELFDPARNAGAARAARQRLGITPGATVVGFVGTFGRWHGAEVLAHAIGRLASSNLSWRESGEVVFLLVGDGVGLPRVREIVEASGAAGLVRFPGLVPQLEAPAYLSASDVLVSPHVPNADGTPFFGSPTKLFEYMAAGKAIVASRLDQIGDVLAPALDARHLPEGPPRSDETAVAVLTQPGDEEELARALAFAIANPEWRTALGVSARARVCDRYTWGHHVGAILEALEAAGYRRESQRRTADSGASEAGSGG
jgi:glycosyltransferase involved in cell wall biosynthesis